jgi:hypothetical protein
MWSCHWFLGGIHVELSLVLGGHTCGAVTSFRGDPSGAVTSFWGASIWSVTGFWRWGIHVELPLVSGGNQSRAVTDYCRIHCIIGRMDNMRISRKQTVSEYVGHVASTWPCQQYLEANPNSDIMKRFANR